ncbi:hypothetical protein AgCh_005968 [Apium graveolens]
MAATCVSCSSNFKILFLSLALLVNLSISTFISDDIFASQASAGRNLLQAKQATSTSMESIHRVCFPVSAGKGRTDLIALNTSKKIQLMIQVASII